MPASMPAAWRRSAAWASSSADGGASWQEAAPIEAPAGKDAMVRWQGAFSLGAGETLTLVVRATDGDGEVQTAQFSLPQPDGGSGRHSIQVSAG